MAFVTEVCAMMRRINATRQEWLMYWVGVLHGAGFVTLLWVSF